MYSTQQTSWHRLQSPSRQTRELGQFVAGLPCIYDQDFTARSAIASVKQYSKDGSVMLEIWLWRYLPSARVKAAIKILISNCCL